MNIRSILFAIFCLLVFSVTIAAAQGMPPGPHPGPGHHPSFGPPPPPPAFWKDPQVVKMLGLSDSQVKSLDDLDAAFHEQEISLRAEVEKAHFQLERLMNASDSNEQDVLKAARKAADLQSRMFLQHIENRVKVHKVLSADQWKKLMTLPPPPAPGSMPERGGE